jgi:hypothetical protein
MFHECPSMFHECPSMFHECPSMFHECPSLFHEDYCILILTILSQNSETLKGIRETVKGIRETLKGIRETQRKSRDLVHTMITINWKHKIPDCRIEEHDYRTGKFKIRELYNSDNP